MFHEFHENSFNEEFLKKTLNKKEYEELFRRSSQKIEDARTIMAIIDIMLRHCCSNALKNRRDIEEFLDEYKPQLKGFRPVVREIIGAILKMIDVVFTVGPLAFGKNSNGKEIKLHLNDFLLFKRNLLSVFIGDPIKRGEEFIEGQNKN